MNENILKNEQIVEATPVDAMVEVKVEAGGTGAMVFIHPPVGTGLHVTKDMIHEALRNKNICHGLIEKQISLITIAKRYDDWITIAMCTPAKHGENGKIEYLFEQKVENVPTEDAKGFVDYKNLGTVRNITAGTVIANITKETSGENGKNVLGEDIVAKKGVPAKVTFGENIGYSQDGLNLVVLADGNLVYKSGRFAVEKVFKLDGNVDVSTGNIDFIGEVIIRGDVQEGFTVKSMANITVQGGAFGATLEAKGSIVVKNGSIGSKLTAGGKIEIDFAENSNITCCELLKSKSLYFCEVFCKGEINCLLGNGNIVGGRITATKNISVLSIGSKNYTPSSIILGDNAIMLEEKNGLLKDIEQINIEIENCEKIIAFLNQKLQQLKELPKDKLDILRSANNTVILRKEELDEKQQRIEEIDLYLQTKQNLFVSCRKELNPGTKIVINDQIFSPNTTYQHCHVGLGDDGIVVSNL